MPVLLVACDSSSYTVSNLINDMKEEVNMFQLSTAIIQVLSIGGLALAAYVIYLVVKILKKNAS
ncbi:hypothetical protein PCCS19_43570 [Paenibacillus sp. CCS19]|nr:hypothetical protein PCCS19_43570 [Paenibacillus cellulosilyticus]